MTPDADRHAAPGAPAPGSPPRPVTGDDSACSPGQNWGHHLVNDGGRRRWRCTHCEYRRPWNVDGEA